jgi:hypothetical protein
MLGIVALLVGAASSGGVDEHAVSAASTTTNAHATPAEDDRNPRDRRPTGGNVTPDPASSERRTWVQDATRRVSNCC